MDFDAPVSLNKKKVPSPAWNYFKRLNSQQAQCQVCKKKLSHRTSLTNLKRHLLVKHKINFGHKITKPFTKLDKQIDVKSLIYFVKQYPCLWSSSYHSLNLSQDQSNAWQLIAAALCPSLDPVIAEAQLSERFAALKDIFYADKQRMANDSIVKTSGFYQDLQFLDGTNDLCIPETATIPCDNGERVEIFEINELKDESNDSDIVQISGEDESMHNNQTFRGTNSNGYIVVKTTQRDGAPTTPAVNGSCTGDGKTPPQLTLQLQNADKDVLFLLSLTDELKKVPDQRKPEFKAELMLTLSRLVKHYCTPSDANFTQ